MVGWAPRSGVETPASRRAGLSIVRACYAHGQAAASCLSLRRQGSIHTHDPRTHRHLSQQAACRVCI